MGRYSNPIARDGDFADPFVLRFDGRYYLYCTNADVRCWSSADLVDWTLEGPTIAPGTFGDLVPFAPEVVYANGSFFMYTSPSGHGHHVLRSDAPTGPFVPVTGNVGRGIDGTVLVNDDGRWYYFWAGDEGIWGCEMPSPTEFGEPVLTGAFMNGWTEGPFVTKRDGWYHMTLTGNHFLSAGYRINAAVSRDPLRGYQDGPLNPVLVSTTKPTVGLGHSSTVPGPDLVSHYLAYHNLNPDRTRDLNVDRVVWNGQALQVLGPTTSAPAPRMPDAATAWHSGAEGWLATAGRIVVAGGNGELSGEGASARWEAAAVGGVFTSEHNLAALGPGAQRYGVLVGHDERRLLVRFDASDGTVALVDVDGGTERVGAAAALPAGYAHEALHCVRLVVDGGAVVVFVDGRRQLAAEVAVTPGGHLGCFTSGGTLRLGYAAVTHGVEAEASRTAAKPVPGRFWAALTTTPGAALEPVGGPVPYDRLVLEPGDEARYALDAADGGRCTVFLTGDFTAGAAVAIGLDGVGAGVGRADGHVLALPVHVPAGGHELSLHAVRGRSAIELVTVQPAQAVPAGFELTGPVELVGHGKLVFGDQDLHDCTVEAELRVVPAGPVGHGDVVVRASQLAEGFAGDEVVPEIDYLLGYSVQLRAEGVVLARHDYDERVLVRRDGPLDPSVQHRVVVRARGSRITVEVDGVEPIEYDDPRPHLVGGAGVRVSSGTIRADRFSVRP